MQVTFDGHCFGCGPLNEDGLRLHFEPTPDGAWLVAAGLKGHIFVIDLHSRKLAKTFDAPTALGKVLVRPDGGVAYISFLTAGKIEVLDLKSWQLQPSIDLTPGVDGMAWASN